MEIEEIKNLTEEELKEIRKEIDKAIAERIANRIKNELPKKIIEDLENRGRWTTQIPWPCARCGTHPITISKCKCSEYPVEHYRYWVSRCPPYETKYRCTDKIEEAIEWAIRMVLP